MFQSLLLKLFSFLELLRKRKLHYLLRDIERENDPLVKTEKQIVFAILGISLGGMAGSTAFTEFKSRYYDSIVDQGKKNEIEEALIRILTSSKYSMKVKARVCYVCADIRLTSAIKIMESFLPQLREGSSEERMVFHSLEALYRNISITEMNYAQFKKR